MLNNLTVIIATYNRADSLARTLEGMSRSSRDDLSIEFVLVDNASEDHTKSVVDSFSGRLPIRYIFEPKRGKNRALNAALERTALGSIVVFTDDDVDVSEDWLVSIWSVCNRWPAHSVFGGRIEVIFPVESVPQWAHDPYIRSFAFACQDYSGKECLYTDCDVPYGPNYWVRKEIFERGFRFNESLGPHPTNRILMDETALFMELLDKGYKIVYSPIPVVWHRIEPQILKFSSLCKRAYQNGRGIAHIYGVPHIGLMKQRPMLWLMQRKGAIVWNALKFLSSIFSFRKHTQMNKRLSPIINIGYQVESMRLGNQINIDQKTFI